MPTQPSPAQPSRIRSGADIWCLQAMRSGLLCSLLVSSGPGAGELEIRDLKTVGSGDCGAPNLRLSFPAAFRTHPNFLSCGIASFSSLVSFLPYLIFLNWYLGVLLSLPEPDEI